MPSSQKFLTTVLGVLSELPGISHRKMMGEYILYYRKKIVGGIYDDRLLVKPVPAAKRLVGNHLEVPYEGAKQMILVEDFNDEKFLRELFEAMHDELPEPRKKQ